MASIKQTTFSNESSIQQNESFYLDCTFFDYPFSFKITEIFVLSVILLSSLIGNTLLITIVFKRPELRNTVNYFIVNMAVSDFVFPLLSIPVRLEAIVSSSWQWHIEGMSGLIFCKFYVFVERVSLAVSGQSLCWIALDRFVAVVFPMKVHLISSRFRALAMASTWVIATITRWVDLYLTEFMETDVGVVCKRPEYAYVTAALWFKYYLTILVVFFNVLPLILMTILYSIITLTLRKQNKSLFGSEVHQRTRRKESAIRMSFCIMASFYIFSVLPTISNSLLFTVQKAYPCPLHLLFLILGYSMFCVSSVINPIICLTFVSSYRRGLKEILSCCFSKRPTASSSRIAQTKDEIKLQAFSVIPEMQDNLGSSET